MIARNDSVLWTELGGHVVLLGKNGSHYFEMNALGGVIWRLLENPCSLPAIIDHVTANYRVERDACGRDVAKFVNQMTEARLVVGVESSSQGNSETNAAT